jgi:hypothetical protein
MARSRAEIQADLAATRALIEGDLDRVEARLRRWWVPALLLAGGVVAGVALSRGRVRTVLRGGIGLLRAGIRTTAILAAVDRYLADTSRRRVDRAGALTGPPRAERTETPGNAPLA